MPHHLIGEVPDGHPQNTAATKEAQNIQIELLAQKTRVYPDIRHAPRCGLASGHPDFRNRPLPVQWRGRPDICHTRQGLLPGRFFLRRRVELAAAIPTNIMLAPRPIGGRTCVAIFAARHARRSANPAACKLFSLFLWGAILTSFMLRSSAVSNLVHDAVTLMAPAQKQRTNASSSE